MREFAVGDHSGPQFRAGLKIAGTVRHDPMWVWPFVENAPATQWLAGAPICDEDKAKILSGNAKRVLRM